MSESQRTRLLVAMLHCVAENGYAPTTVADVVARAAVSRSTFYGQFADKEACFVASYEFAMEHVLETLEAGERATGSGWRTQVRAALSAYLDALAREPAVAVTLHVEVLAAGPEALEHRARMLGLLATQIATLNAAARREQPELPEIPPAAFALYTGGLDELIRDRLRVGTPDGLRELVAPVLDATYALFGAPPASAGP
ncbi:MAG TPA: TetR/AcrR family transcriptional regulator [Solirubrobacteraceae bacterium]|nr:TetR/AcrR family transcriptional regulator [Solirubrobacteraceae bacterium]